MSSLLNIIINPDPILRKKSEKIELKKIHTPEFAQLLKDMKKTMIEKDGVGLAAPQIGKNIRLIAINTKDGPVSIINPEIVRRSWRKEWGEEGCLSVPEIFGQVRRHRKTTVAFLDEKGNKKVVTADGLLARIFQHEIDHLDGILFIDKARNIQKLKTKN